MECPAIAEYGDIKRLGWRMSVETLLGTHVRERDGRVYKLSHHAAGYEVAGSCARWTNEKWSVRFMLDGARHGKSFASWLDAVCYFRKRQESGS